MYAHIGSYSMKHGGEKMRNKSVWLLPLLGLAIVALSLRTMAPVNAQGGPGKPTVIRDYKHDVSPPLRDIQPRPIPPRPQHEEQPPRSTGIQHRNAGDPVVQSALAQLAMPS